MVGVFYSITFMRIPLRVRQLLGMPDAKSEP